MNAMAMDALSRRMPSQLEIENANQLRQIVASAIRDDQDTVLKVVHPKERTAEPITLAPAIAQSLLEVLRLISSGSGFMVIPVTAELTTQQAADLLNVSRPFLVGLLEKGEIDFHKVGRHRRVKAVDLFAYKEKRDRVRDMILEEMAAADAESGLI